MRIILFPSFFDSTATTTPNVVESVTPDVVDVQQPEAVDPGTDRVDDTPVANQQPEQPPMS